MFFFFFFFLLIWTASLLESTNKLLLSSSPPPPPLELLGKPIESFYGIARKRGSAFKSVVVSLGRSPLVSPSLSLSSSFSPINPFSLFSLSLPFFPLSRYTISLRYFIDTFALRNGTTVENFKWKIIVSTFPLRFHYLFPPVVQRCTVETTGEFHTTVYIFMYIYVYTHTDIYTCVVFERTNPLRLKFTFAFADDIYAVFAWREFTSRSLFFTVFIVSHRRGKS